MDRLNQLRGDVGASQDSTLNTSSLLGDAYMTANDSSKYFSLSEVDSSSTVSPSKEPAVDVTAENSLSHAERIISNLSPIPKKTELDSFKIGEQIEAANILSGGVNIFDDNDNSYDGDELVIDDAVTEGDEKLVEPKLGDNAEAAFEKTERLAEASLDDVDAATPTKDTEVVLQIDGKNVDAIDIGNGLYLYRKDGEEELAAVQILDNNHQQPDIKFLKVRENAEGNLEVYEEIEIEVPKEVPTKEGKAVKNISHTPVKDVNKISESDSNKVTDNKSQVTPKDTISSECELDVNKDTNNCNIESKTEVNLNGKMMKFSESRKSPLIGTFTPMTYHSTPNKEGIPLTKTMVDLQLHPNRHSENVKKTIEVHTDNCKQRLSETTTRSSKDSYEQNKSPGFVPLTLDKGLANYMNVDEINQNNTEINNSSIDNKISEVASTKVKQAEKTHDHALEDKQTKIFDKNNFENNVDNKPEMSDVKISKQVLEKSSVTLGSECKSNIKSSDKVDHVNETDSKINNDIFINKHPEEIKNVPQTENTEKRHTERVETKVSKSNDDLTSRDSTLVIEKEGGNKNISDAKKIISSQTTDTLITEDQNTLEKNTPKSTNLESDANKSEKKKNNTKNYVILKDSKQFESNSIEVLDVSPKLKQIQESNQVNKSLEKLGSSTKTEDVKDINVEMKIFESQSIKELENLPENEKTNKNIQPELTATQDSMKILKSTETKTDTLLSQPKSVNILSNSTKKEQIAVPELKQPKNDCKNNLCEAKETKSNIGLKPFKLGNKAFGSDNQYGKNLKIDEIALIKKNENEIKKKTDNLSKGLVRKSDAKLNQPDIISSKVTKDVSKPAPSTESKNLHKDSLSTEQNCSSSSLVIKTSSAVKTDTLKANEPNQKLPLLYKNTKSSIVTSDEKQSHTTPNVPNEVDLIKNDTKKEPVKVGKVSIPKPSNNNKAAVPFGKWTEANRQEFLNKIKESKVPINTSNASNTKQLKQPNDLNRRDVLQKIDSQRQSNIASSKVQDINILNKIKLKHETPAFTSKSNATQKEKLPENKVLPANSKVQETVSITSGEKTIPPIEKINKEDTAPVIPVDKSSAPLSAKKDPVRRKEINNQDLIDKTIEGIINRAVTAKIVSQDVKQDNIEQVDKVQNPTSYALVSLDEIESKMNELHGIPFVERPPHELPKVVHENKSVATPDVVTASKGSNTSSKLPFTKKLQQKNEDKVNQPVTSKVNEDSDEEIIEHVPVTGDIELNKNSVSVHVPVKDKVQPQQPITPKANSDSKKEAIITENDFDKFARRNSITLENCLTVNFDGKEHHNVVQSVVEKEAVTKKLSRNEIMLAESKAKSHKQLAVRHINFPTKIPSATKTTQDEEYSKNYQSKVQIAYQSVMSAKRQQEYPITIIEDKPVKVVFMDGNQEYIPHQLNVQGKELSPPKKSLIEWDHFTHSNSESLDSDVLDTGSDSKSQDDMKFKSKHQRKQVLTPVEAPELELIEPSDLGIEVSPKKKRKIEDTKPEKNSKSLVPKKSYLLNRSIATNDAPSISQDSSKTQLKEPVNQEVFVKRSDPISAIDNLVKAAELLETQSESKRTLELSDQNSPTQQNSPVKRGRGRPRKYPLPEESNKKSPSPVKTPTPQKKPRLIDAKIPKIDTESEDDEVNSDGELIKENWTMGKINENIVCPICNKLFRSENVVFKHVKHCTGPSPSRSDSDKRSPRRMRQSQDLDWKSDGSKSDSMDADEDYEINKPTKKRKSKEKRSSIDDKPDDKTEVIVIEDTPIKDRDSPSRKRERLKQEPNKTTIKAKAPHGTSSLVCEFCGKTFRQLSYLVNHRLQHKNAESKKSEKESVHKSLFSCEICKKEFRKLHHLVQHRIIHNPNPNPVRSSRKSSSEQNDNKAKDAARVSEDQSAGFRCEPCDKSFRKLHHLVEHRETHDEINKKCNPITSTVVDTTKPTPLHHCDICKKTFKKLQHLIEHKEHHLDTSSEKSDDKSVKSSLSTKDIIHECPLCYMVFPNEHSLTKHHIICQRKKKQSAAKQSKQVEENDTADMDEETKIAEAGDENLAVLEQKPDTNTSCVVIEDDTPIVLEKQEIKVIEVAKPVEQKKEVEQDKEIKAMEVDIPLKPETETKTQINDKLNKSTNKKDGHERYTDKASVKVKKYVAPIAGPVEIIKIPDTPTPKKKLPAKDKLGATVTKRQKTTNVQPVVDKVKTPDSSDDDEIRYMLNPNFHVEESSEGKLFMKVRAKKRNSLQIERPNSKDLMKRRISLQHPPKIPRLKAKPIPRKSINTNTVVKSSKVTIAPVVTEPLASTDSDDSDVKYSFPEPVLKEMAKEAQKKGKRQVIVEKRKSLSKIAKRKSLGKMVSVKTKIPSPAKQIKKRSADAEHRCDCGQLFSSAALLTRHTSLAHTPPRIRRRRSPPPDNDAKPNKRTEKPQETRKTIEPPSKKPGVTTRKSSVNIETKVTSEARKTPKSSSLAKTRRSAPHKGVPVPEKMRKLMDKSKK